jgi:predicted nucleic acid-binding protein
MRAPSSSGGSPESLRSRSTCLPSISSTTRTINSRLSVPATKRAFSEFPPARIYLDTDILVNALISTQPHHERCVAFLDSVVRNGLTTVYLSSLSWLEYVHAITRDNFRRLLPAELQHELQFDRWKESLVRQAYVQRLVGAFDALLTQFDVIEISLTPEIRVSAIQYAAEYNLGSQDAVHLASASHAGVLDLASLDARFRRIDGLYLWDDHIHADTETQA